MLHNNLQLWVKAIKGQTKTYSFRRLASYGERERKRVSVCVCVCVRARTRTRTLVGGA